MPHKDLIINKPADQGVWGLEVDQAGNLWAGTFGGGPILWREETHGGSGYLRS